MQPGHGRWELPAYHPTVAKGSGTPEGGSRTIMLGLSGEPLWKKREGQCWARRPGELRMGSRKEKQSGDEEAGISKTSHREFIPVSNPKLKSPDIKENWAKSVGGGP